MSNANVVFTVMRGTEVVEAKEYVTYGMRANDEQGNEKLRIENISTSMKKVSDLVTQLNRPDAILSYIRDIIEEALL